MDTGGPQITQKCAPLPMIDGTLSQPVPMPKSEDHVMDTIVASLPFTIVRDRAPSSSHLR